MPYKVAVKPTKNTSAFITYLVNTGTTVISMLVEVLMVNATDSNIIRFIKSSLLLVLFINKVITY